MAAKRIPIADLKPGMYVLDPGIFWTKVPLLYMREGFVADQAEADGTIRQGFVEVIHDPDRAIRPGRRGISCLLGITE